MAITRKGQTPAAPACDTTRPDSSIPTSRTTRQAKRVAVIGSGLAGLTTAYLLRQQGVTVYLIEKVSTCSFGDSMAAADS